MLSCEQHLDNLLRHIDLVRQAGVLLGKRLMEQGRKDFGRILIARCYEHDKSKFYGIEWRFLHAGNDVPEDDLKLAITQHTETNSHHPEFHGGFNNMPEMDIAEMVCDWYARSQEFGTGFRDWITETAVERFHMDTKSERFGWVMNFVNILLQDSFVKVNNV